MKIAPGVSGSAANDRIKITRSLSLPYQRSVRQGRLKNKADLVASGALFQKGHRTGRADLLVRIDQHFPADLLREWTSLQRLQRDQHHAQSPLGVGDARTVAHLTDRL